MKKTLTLAAISALLALPLHAEEIAAGEWQVLAVDGALFAAEATFSITPDGQVAGKAPCNRYFGQSKADLPALQLDAIGATRMACDAMAAEDQFLTALSSMTGAELREDHLVLTGPEGRSIELVRDRDDKAAVCLTCAA